MDCSPITYELEFEISWDENDPTESMFNTWTETDFLNAIQEHLDNLKNQDTSQTGT